MVTCVNVMLYRRLELLQVIQLLAYRFGISYEPNRWTLSPRYVDNSPRFLLYFHQKTLSVPVAVDEDGKESIVECYHGTHL